MEQKIKGLIDYNVSLGPNGYWYVSKTIHVNRSPGDASPEDGGIVGEHANSKDAIDDAIARACAVIGNREAESAGVTLNGDAISFMTWNDDVWCYPAHSDPDWRLSPSATNAWMGTIETKAGDEVLDLTVWAGEDFQAAFKFAKEVVKMRNKMRFNLTLEDYD